MRLQRYGFREAVRRKVFAVVLVLTVAFLVLFWLSNHYVFSDLADIQRRRDVPRRHAHLRLGSFLIGLAMFATLFSASSRRVSDPRRFTGDAEREPLLQRLS